MTDWRVIDRQRSLPVAVGQAGEKSAGELLFLAHNLACSLPKVSTPGEVAVLCADRYYFAAAVLGVWLAGHSVALAPNDRPATLQGIHAHHCLIAVLGDGQDAAQVDVRACSEDRTDAPQFVAFPGSRRAARVYSSGTTGTPSVHEKSFAQLLSEAELLGALLGFKGACVLPTVPAQHIYGLLAGVLAPLSSGACFVRETPLHAAQIVGVAAATGATHLVASPAHLKGLAVWARETPSASSRLSLRRVVSSGAPLPADIGEALRGRLGVEVVELFGSTETGGIAQRSSPGTGEWTPLPGVQITTAAALDQVGAFEDQLLVQSPFTGHAGWLATDDLVELTNAGRFLHKSRSDRVGKVGGRRVDLGAIERELAEVPGVLEVAVLGLPVPPPRDLEIACALVAPGVSVQALRAALLQVFDPVAVPRRWRFVQCLPRQANGKPQRSTFAELFDPHTNESVLGVTCETRSCVAGPELDNYTFSISVPRQAWFFQGHFPGDPLMPAVVQVNDVVLAHAQRVWADLPPLRQAQRLKFKRPIRPGDLLTLKLRNQPSALAVHFELYVGEVLCSSGMLEFGGARA